MEKQTPEVEHEELSVQPAFGEKDPEPQTQQEAASDFREHDEELRPPVPNTRVESRTGGTEERPSRWRRLLVIIGMLVVFWLISSIRSAQKAPPKIVHASRYVQLLGYMNTNKLLLLLSLSINRYSKEYKFRPAASPIITEQLKDGRTRIRGAEPTFRADERVASPTARPTAKAKVKGKGKGKVKTKTALQRK